MDVSDTTVEYYTTASGDGVENFSTTILPIANSSVGAGNFTWTIQTVTPPTVIISSSYGYYYLYSFYCCMTLLFLISMITLAVRMSAMKNAARNTENTRRQRAAATTACAATTSNCNNYYNTTTNNNNAPPPVVVNTNYDLPPKYDDLMNTKMGLYDAELGTAGGMTAAISTTTVETNVDLACSVSSVNESVGNNANYPTV